MMIVMIAYGVLICWKGMHSRMQLSSGQPGSRVARPRNASAGGGSAKAKHYTVSLFRISFIIPSFFNLSSTLLTTSVTVLS